MTIQKIKTFLYAQSLLNADKVLLVAFSGGADSLCLVDALHSLSTEYGFKVVAAHLNHGWREEAEQEELNAKDYCNSKNIDFYSETLPSNIPKTELEARNRRYEFLNRIAKKTQATGIFTGHTFTDQAETVIYRILKGTGIHGLKGIPQSRLQSNGVMIYRPMLNISRQETVEYCKKNNLKPSFDKSNQDISFLRNKIRLNLMPELKTYNEEVESALVRLTIIANETEEIIKEHLNEKEKIYFITKEEINLNSFIDSSLAMKRRIIYEFLVKNNFEYDFERTEQFLSFIEKSKLRKSGNTLSIGKDKWLFCSKEKLKIIDSVRSTVLKSVVKICINEKNYLSPFDKNFEILEWKKEKQTSYPKEKDYEALVYLNKIKTPLYIRTRQPGDIIQPFGMKEKVRLKKYLINKGIPEHERDRLLLLTNEEEVLWVVGVGLSELLKVIDLPTHRLKIY